ncbi:MAG: 4Fe-4S binding protein [Euryarchaeota archaeon]|nr:4Fe-4S binding protein [Euryarchaeota archaeon]
MKGIVCCYSATGNTRLAAEYVARHLGFEFALHDVRNGAPDFSNYDFAGFASPTDWLEEPMLMRSFMRSLTGVNGKAAFVLVTHGGMPGKTPASIARAATEKGFVVVGCHVLKAPDSYPPIVAQGRPRDASLPLESEMRALDDFISGLRIALAGIADGKEAVPVIVKTPFAFRIMPSLSRERSKKAQGPKSVDAALCTKCGTCARACPYVAIELSSTPAFDEEKCMGCWACFNLCPTKAIYAGKLRGTGHYKGPLKRYREVLSK